MRVWFLTLCLIAATATRADSGSLSRLQTLAEGADRFAFKTELSALRGQAPAVYEDIERVWDYAESSSMGAFIAGDDLARRYPDLDAAVPPVTDSSGQKFYPTKELRAYLARIAPSFGARVSPPAPVQPPPRPAREDTRAPIAPAPSAPSVDVTFRDALTRSMRPSQETQAELDRALLELQRIDASRLPTFRANADARTARTTDVFADRPLNLQSISTTVSAEYSIVSPRLIGARRNEAAARVETLRARIVQDRASYEKVIDAYADAYRFRKQQELLSVAATSLERSDTEASHLLETGQISLVNAANARESLLAIRARMLDLEMQRLAAERRLKDLLGDRSEDVLVADLAADIDRAESSPLDRDSSIETRVQSDPLVTAIRNDIGQSRLAVQEAASRAGLRTDFSAYAGIGAARSNFEGLSSQTPGIGIYGVNIHLSYPLFDPAPRIGVATARADLGRNEARLATAVADARARAEQEWLEYVEAGRRIALLQEWSKVQREREESLTRLVRAGVRRDADLSQAIVDRARHDEELLQARLQRWRLYHLLQFPRGTS